MSQTKPFAATLVACLFFLISCQKDPVIPQNSVPTVEAGQSQSIILPVKTVSLSGSGSDTDGQITAYLWSQVSGPSPTTIVNPGSPSTRVEGLIEGTYLFQLMATDNKGATGVDTTSIIVNPGITKTLALQPANNANEFQYLIHNGNDGSYSGALDIPVEAWTSDGAPYTVREAIKFDLSSIPADATIVSAYLSLYSYPTPTLNGNLIDANYGVDNSMLVQQITSDWSPATTNWFHQPATTTTNQIIVPTTTQSELDLNLDVTDIVNSIVENNANYGFFLKLQNEATYNSRIFVSSYNTTYAAKHPKLVIVYQ